MLQWQWVGSLDGKAGVATKYPALRERVPHNEVFFPKWQYYPSWKHCTHLWFLLSRNMNFYIWLISHDEDFLSNFLLILNIFPLPILSCLTSVASFSLLSNPLENGVVFLEQIIQKILLEVFIWSDWTVICGSDDKVPAYNAGDLGSIPGSGRSPGEGYGNPLQSLAWKIPWMEEHCRLQSIGLQRVGHDLETKQQQLLFWARPWSS